MGSNANSAGYIGYNMGNTSTSNTWKYISADTGSALYFAGNEFRFMQFASGSAGATTSGTQAMTLDAIGNLLVGLTSALGSQLGVQAAGGNGTSFTLRHTSATAGKYRLAGIDSSNNYLVYNNSNVGMYMTDGGTSWTATSDETQKILTSEFSNAATFLLTVRATRGRYKADDENTSRSFLIAQDWQEYLPEAISKKDGILGLSPHKDMSKKKLHYLWSLKDNGIIDHAMVSFSVTSKEMNETPYALFGGYNSS
jgi:hypothetical protein